MSACYQGLEALKNQEHCLFLIEAVGGHLTRLVCPTNDRDAWVNAMTFFVNWHYTSKLCLSFLSLPQSQWKTLIDTQLTIGIDDVDFHCVMSTCCTYTFAVYLVTWCSDELFVNYTNTGVHAHSLSGEKDQVKSVIISPQFNSWAWDNHH